MRQVNFFWSGTHGRFSPGHILTSTFCLLGTNVVSIQTRNLPVLEMAFPFPAWYWHPFPVLSFFGFHFWKFSIWYSTVPKLAICHYWYWAWLTSYHFRNWALPVPVRVGAPYQNWTLCASSHFRNWAMPFLGRSFIGPRTRTGLYACGPISDFRYVRRLREAGLKVNAAKSFFLYPRNRIPRLHISQRRDQTPTKESTGNSHDKSAEQCQGTKTLLRNGTIHQKPS